MKNIYIKKEKYVIEKKYFFKIRGYGKKLEKRRK